jgi:hypothetical protein
VVYTRQNDVPKEDYSERLGNDFGTMVFSQALSGKNEDESRASGDSSAVPDNKPDRGQPIVIASDIMPKSTKLKFIALYVSLVAVVLACIAISIYLFVSSKIALKTATDNFNNAENELRWTKGSSWNDYTLSFFNSLPWSAWIAISVVAAIVLAFLVMKLGTLIKKC